MTRLTELISQDLKADNILVDHNGTCKISDFGISKRTSESHVSTFHTIAIADRG